VYGEGRNEKGKRNRATPEVQEEKHTRFKQTFGMTDLYYTRKVGRYFLVFLALDNPATLAGMSQTQLAWLRAELERNRRKPTIIFFHAPLNGTLLKHPGKDFVAQPVEEIRTVILQNPQIFLWVSGHTHTPPSSESFAAPVNVYEGRVTNIHTCDMERKQIWTNSLYLYPDKVLVRTFDHAQGGWMERLDRTILPPQVDGE